MGKHLSSIEHIKAKGLLQKERQQQESLEAERPRREARELTDAIDKASLAGVSDNRITECDRLITFIHMMYERPRAHEFEFEISWRVFLRRVAEKHKPELGAKCNLCSTPTIDIVTANLRVLLGAADGGQAAGHWVHGHLLCAACVKILVEAQRKQGDRVKETTADVCPHCGLELEDGRCPGCGQPVPEGGVHG